MLFGPSPKPDALSPAAPREPMLGAGSGFLLSLLRRAQLEQTISSLRDCEQEPRQEKDSRRRLFIDVDNCFNSDEGEADKTK